MALTDLILQLYIISKSLIPTKWKDFKVTTLKNHKFLFLLTWHQFLLRHAIFGRYHRKQAYKTRGANHFRPVNIC